MRTLFATLLAMATAAVWVLLFTPATVMAVLSCDQHGGNMTDGKEPGTVEIKTFDNGETYDVVLTIRGTTSILDPDEAHDLAARLSTAAAGAEARKGEPRAWFAIIKDRVGQYRFNLQVRSIAGKGEIIAASEGYPRKENARNGIESVKRHAPGADVYDETEEDDNR